MNTLIENPKYPDWFLLAVALSRLRAAGALDASGSTAVTTTRQDWRSR